MGSCHTAKSTKQQNTDKSEQIMDNMQVLQSKDNNNEQMTQVQMTKLQKTMIKIYRCNEVEVKAFMEQLIADYEKEIEKRILREGLFLLTENADEQYNEY